MGFTDVVNYAVFTNPLSKGMWSVVSHGINSVGPKSQAITQTASSHTASAVQQVIPPLWKLLGRSRHVLKLAGLSGAAAVMLGAYGAHYHFPTANEKGGRDQRQVFEMTNRYHFIHSLALLAAPLARRPYLTALLMTSGIMLFCGSCYYISFTDDRSVGKVTPVGGFLLIFGWLSFIL